MKRLAFLLAVLLLAAIPIAAAENITELRIEDITASVETGQLLKFSYSAGNMIGQPCNARIEYWIGSENLKLSQGQDTVFLAEGQIKGATSSLLVPDETIGIRGFFLEMQCNETTVMASKPIKANAPMPTMLEFTSLDVQGNGGQDQLEFSYTLKSNRSETLPIYIEETILRDGNIVWENSQESFVTASNSFVRRGPILEQGNYEAVVKASHAGKTAKMTRKFAIKSEFSMLMVIPVGLATILTASFVGGYYFSTRKNSRKSNASPKGPASSPGQSLTITAPGREELAAKAKNYVCLIESKSKPLDKAGLNRLLDDAGFSKEEKKAGLEFADRIPIEQTVNSAVFIDRFNNPNCETTVTITVSNNTGKDWCDLSLIARIPGFLSDNISELVGDGTVQAIKEGSIARFTVPKIAAMQSASIVYSIAKWVPQEKADSIQLPAAVSYKDGQPLVIRLEKAGKLGKKAGLAQEEKQFYAEIEAKERDKEQGQRRIKKRASRKGRKKRKALKQKVSKQ